MKKDDCIFCKIANGEIPSATVYEDELFRVILDIAPAVKGHALILPKEHYDNLWALGKEESERVMNLAAKVSEAQKKALGCDGINLLQNNGVAAGQTVFHFHMHLIPRYDDDKVTIPWNTLSYAEGEAAKVCETIKAAMQ
ncbi:MAG: HIT family protein [Lachnospiraceae bacterium]|nr:HIT family protein [Lachnospiraceae bacterium]